MRFDLELPPLNNNKLVYVQEGEDIKSFLCPLSYYSIDTRDTFISDFISAEEAFAIKEFSADGFEILNGPSFSITSDKILLTHVSKFSSKLGVEIPLFYKCVLDETVTPDTIKITDYYGLELNSSEYMIEVYDKKTYIYMNKTENIYFIEFVSNSKFTKKLLGLVPVFNESTWENLSIYGTITDFEYTINGDTLTTNYNGKLYLSYINNVRMFKKPCGNLDDSWNVGVLNSNFNITKNGKTYNYSTPEFYRQKFDGSENVKLVENKKCKKIFPNVLKSQYNIAGNMLDSVYIYIEDFYTKQVKYALTTNSYYVNTLYSGNVYYIELKELSIDGYFYLPIELKENEIAFATHYTTEEYYIYTKLNLNSLEMGNNTYVAIYMKPDVLDTSSSISHAFIGDVQNKVSNGDILYFNNYEDYINSINNSNFLHIALVTVASFINTGMVTTFDARCESGRLLNKEEAYKTDIDALYFELAKGDIVLPTNDTVVANLNISRLEQEGKMNESNKDNYLAFILDKLYKNLDVTTKAILKTN